MAEEGVIGLKFGHKRVSVLAFTSFAAMTLFFFVLSLSQQDKSAKIKAAAFRSTLPGLALLEREQEMQVCANTPEKCHLAMSRMRSVAFTVGPLEQMFEQCLKRQGSSDEQCRIFLDIIHSSPSLKTPATGRSTIAGQK